MHRTLRFRLMAWNAAVVIITALVTLLGVREGVRYTLIHELDQLLIEDVREIELSIGNVKDAQSPQLHEQLDRKDAGHAQHKWFVRLIDLAGNTLYESQHAPYELIHLKPQKEIPQTSDNWRVFERATEQVNIRVGSSLDLIHADIRRIDRLVAMAAGVVLLIAPLGGYWLAGRATRPLNNMISTMARVRPSRLDERLAIRGSGDELDRMSAAFNGLLDRIGSYLQEHRDLLANAAHELRTPLAAIRSSVEVALAKQRSVESYEVLLSEIIDESASLELLVNQLLLLSESEGERLKVHAETIRFDELVGRALDMFSGVAEFREIELVSEALPQIELHGNPQHLKQVIYNLIDNALKFTPSGGRVHVNLSVRDCIALFSVRDTGYGVLPQDLPLLFNRFFRGSQPSVVCEVKGTGLGLSICRAIVRAHAGDIHVESRYGHGATFRVELPMAASIRHSNSH